MARYGYALTWDDAVLAEALAGAPRLLAKVAVGGGWNARCDRIQARLNFYGLGRN